MEAILIDLELILTWLLSVGDQNSMSLALKMFNWGWSIIVLFLVAKLDEAILIDPDLIWIILLACN